MENKNFSFKSGGFNTANNFTDNQNMNTNINLDFQTTTQNTNTLPDMVKKQKKLYDDIMILSSNLNLNFDTNDTIDNNNTISKNNEEISTDSHMGKAIINKDALQKLTNSSKNNTHLSKGNQRQKINELISKFNNIYKNENLNNDEYNNDEKEMNTNDFGTINTNDMNGISISYDDINYKKQENSINLNKHKYNKTNDISDNLNNISNEQEVYSYINKKLNNKYKNKINLNYYPNDINIFPEEKIYSNHKNSKSCKDLRNKKLISKSYNNLNINIPEISNTSKNANMIINEFKKTLLEAEKTDNEFNKSKYSMKTFSNGKNIINNRNTIANLNNTNTDIYNTISALKANKNKDNFNEFSLDDKNIEKLIIQNQILLKSNMILKNQNKMLSHEINTYKNSSLYNNPYNQNDRNLNAFIQELKNCLDNATQNNEDLENIITNTQEENQELSNKNKQLLSNFELAKNECQKMAKEISELKVELENKNEEINNNENNIKEFQKEINSLNNVINENVNKINYLSNIQKSNKVTQKDNEDLIAELKNTIENLQKINIENNHEKIDLKNKAEEYKNAVKLRQNEIKALNENIKEKDIIIKNKENQIVEYTEIINKTNNKNIQNKNQIQNSNIENEKLKNEIKTIKMLLADREKTIESLKNSISFLTNTYNKNINLINNNINNALSNDETENFDINKGLNLIIEKMQKEIYESNKKLSNKEKERIRLEKEINAYNEQYEQIKYDYQILFQKYKEQNKIIEMIKTEFLKRNNDNEIQHLTKVNFDILAKLKKSQEENIIKTQQLEQLKKNYELINNHLIEYTNTNNNSNNNSQSNNSSMKNSNNNNKYKNFDQEIVNYENNKNIIENTNNSIDVSEIKNNKINLEGAKNIQFFKNKNENEYDNDNENIIKITESNIDDNLLQYSNDTNFEKDKFNSNNNNNNNTNDKIEDINCTESNNDINYSIKKQEINNQIRNNKINNKNSYYNNNESDMIYNGSSKEGNLNEKNDMNELNLNTESYKKNHTHDKKLTDVLSKYSKLATDENIVRQERFYTFPMKVPTKENEKNDNFTNVKKQKNDKDNNDNLTPMKENFRDRMNKMEDILNNLENITSANEQKSESIHLPKSYLNNISQNDKNSKNYQDSLDVEIKRKDKDSSDQNFTYISLKNLERDQSLLSYPNIYTLKENKIISFNLLEKKFILIKPKDKTNGVFYNYISKCSNPPLSLNTKKGFFILLDKYIFNYSSTNNTITILKKLSDYHEHGGFVFINNEIYSLSGKDCLKCEKYSLTKKINIKLPNVNYARINSGFCNINNEYLYAFFGDKSGNSVERLNLSIDYESMSEYINNWEYMQINSVMENGDKISLERFTVFMDDYSNVIILGGNDNKGNVNQEIYGLNLANNELNVIGKIDTCALYIGQNVQLDESIFAIYDTKNGLHFFNKELDYHEIYNFKN